MSFRIHPSCILFWGIVILFRGGSGVLFTAAAALAHECGHLLSAVLLKVPIRGITLLPFGAEITTGEVHGWRAIAVTSAGGIVNFAVFFLTRTRFPLLAGISFLLGFMNLLPIRSLDGGAILEQILEPRLLPSQTERVMQTVSFLFVILLWVASLYLLFYVPSQYSLFFICVILFASLCLRSR